MSAGTEVYGISGDFIIGQFAGSGGFYPFYASTNGQAFVVPANYNKDDGGQQVIAGDLVVDGDVNINAGIMVVNGALTATQVNVNADGTLRGRGLIVGNTYSSGKIAPGNSPGTLTIMGNFTQTSAGTLELEIGSLSVFDRLIVSGTATLAGNLQVVEFEQFQLAYGQQIPFLQAGNIVGTFDNIYMPHSDLFRGRFIVDGNTGILVVAPASYTLVAKNDSQRSLGKALDSFITAGGDREAVSTALDLLSENQYQAAFDAISPAFYQTVTGMGISLSTSLGQIVSQRLTTVRTGGTGFNTQGLGANVAQFDGEQFEYGQGDSAPAKEAKDNILVATPGNPWGLWVQGNGIFGNTYSVQDVPSYHYASGGFLVGSDYRWSENLSTGAFVGYQGAYASYANNGKVTMNGVNFGTYATYDANNGFYANGILMGGYSNSEVNRPIVFSTVDRMANSNLNSGTFATFLETGYDFNAGNFVFGPVVNAQYTYLGVAPFTENNAGALDLSVGQQNANSLQTNAGGRIAYVWKVPNKEVVIVPEVRMFWNHEFLQNPTGVSASLSGGAGPSFTYNTVTPSRDSVFAGIGFTAELGGNWNFRTYYNVNFGSATSNTHIISFDIGYRF